MKYLNNLFLFLFIIIKTNVYCQTPVYYDNFPLQLDSLRESFEKAGVPLITDLDKDGQKEIITAGLDYNGSVNPQVMLYVIKSDGSYYPNFPKGYYTASILDIASGDIDGDGFLDIVLRMRNSIDVIDRFGNHLSGFPLSYIDNDPVFIKFISLYDLDNDGKLEIIVSREGELCVFNFNGGIRAGWPRFITGKAPYNPAIGDIDGDGYAEIILNSFKQNNSIVDSGAISVFRQNGDIFNSNWPLRLDSNYISWSSSPSLYINKNNRDLSFIAVVAGKLIDGGAYGNHKLMKINITGDIIEKNYTQAYMDFGTLVMGDIKRNGNLNFASGTQYSTKFSAFDNYLKLIKGWPNYGTGEHWATGVIGKLKYGNNLEIMDNTWSAQAGNGNGYIYSYSPDGVNLPWSPLRPYGLVNGVSLADLNNDGSVEIIATSSQQFKLFLPVWTIPGIPYTNEDFPWPQYGHDRYRSNQYGFIPPDEPVGIQPSSTIVPDKFSLHQNFPNPFNPATTIKFDINNSGVVTLSIFDALGRQIETLVNERLKAGTYSLTFDGSKYNSGVYFYRLVVSSSNPLTTDNYTESRKMLMVK